jgi:ribosomal protein S18 acetylase RimI-like enzyme
MAEPLISIRQANVADVEVIAPLFNAYRQFYEQPSDLALARTFIAERLQNNESVVLLASTPQLKAVGFCQLYPTFCSVEAKPIYSLYDLFVQPEARRSGTGKALLLAAEQLAQAHGKARMDLTTARTNGVAQAAYESLGWVRDDVFFAYSRRVDTRTT